MAIENRLDLRELNPYLELNINHIAMGTFDYDRVEVFPVDILGFTIASDGATSIRNMETGETYYPRAGFAHFIPCGLKVRHVITSANVFVALHFNLTFFNGADIFSGQRGILSKHDPALVGRVRALMDEKDRLKTICALKAEVLNFCFHCWPEKGVPFSLAQARKYEPLFRYIHERNDAALTVEELASFAGLRKDSFSRAFSRDIGKSPNDFLQEDLLRRIIARLLLPDVRLKEIADELKFSDEFYMSRFFKRHTGISPKEYQAKFRP